MKYLARLVALFVIAIGLTGIATPDRLFDIGSLVATQTGLLVVAVIRVAIGVVLIMIAPRSRMPKALQIVGAAVLGAWLATPLFGVDRTRAVLAWEIAQGPVVIRIGGAIAVAIGGLLAFALTSRKATSVS
jgi:hypothetical protein